MSLISGANFVAPLRSKVQIVSIFALAVLVAVLRVTGSSKNSDSAGGASTAREQTQVSPKTTIGADDVDSYLASRRRSKVRADTSGARDVTVEKLLQGEDSDIPERAVHREDEGSGSQPEKLNDIKRSLGLE